MTRFLLAALLALTTAPALAAPTSTDPMFGPRTLYGWGGWLASFGDQAALGVGEPVHVFAAGREVARAEIAILAKKGTKAYAAAGLLARGPDAPPVAVGLADAKLGGVPVMAVRALAPFHKVVGGVAKPMPLGKPGSGLTALLDGARVRRKPGTLVTGVAYRGLAGSPVIVDAYVGVPTWGPGKKAMTRVDVQRLTFLDGKRVFSKGYARRADTPERADAEPPTLTATSWALDSEETLGFVGLPDGRWYRLAADPGPEGIRYEVELLTRGETVFDAYHYTPH